MAFSAVGALVGGAAASTTLVLGAIAEVGMTMSVVGAVVGDKKLMKIGAVLGVVGGVGGMIARAGTAAASSVSAGAEAAAGEGLQQLGEAGGYVIGSDRVTTVDDFGFMHKGVARYSIISRPEPAGAAVGGTDE